jgi:hypothetical protein
MPNETVDLESELFVCGYEKASHDEQKLKSGEKY